jgi:hypothetical protein
MTDTAPTTPLPWDGQPYSIKRHGVSITNCDSEPIQTPGCIQAHGALLVLRPVVFSTSADPRDLAFCYTAGANAYHVKPVRYPDHLLLVIEILTYWLGRVALPDAGGYK